MAMYRRSMPLLITALTLLGLTGCEKDPAQALVGKPFPSFALPTPGGTDSVKSSQLQGGPALVVFWATWCGPCGEEVEELRQVLSEYQGRGLKIVGLSVDETAAPVPLMVQKLSIPYPVATGALPLFDSLKLESLPQSFLLDKNGVIKESFTGLHSAKTFREAIDGAL
ncbi:MAG: hypothetical protein RL173_2805 [Fibrobacterota bacterium]